MAVSSYFVFISLLVQLLNSWVSGNLGQWEEQCSHSCGGGIQRMINNKCKTRMCNVFDCPADAGCMTTHYTFDSLSEGRAYDASGNVNYGVVNGVASLDQAGKLGQCLHVPKGGNISLGSQTFHNRPRSAITIATWVKLPSVDGLHEIFYTCSSDVPNGKEQFQLEINDGTVRWLHRNPSEETVFHVDTESKITASTWTHVAATYRVTLRQAKIYINGEATLLKDLRGKFGAEAKVEPDLSPDWGCAYLGDYKTERPLDGFIDDFFIFKCELLALEIKQLFETGTFKRYSIPVPP